MFGVGMPELMIIFVIALLVFGPKELPKIARSIGKAMAELRRASDDLRDGIQREIDLATKEEPEPPSTPPEAVPSAPIPGDIPPPPDMETVMGAEMLGGDAPGREVSEATAHGEAGEGEGKERAPEVAMTAAHHPDGRSDQLKATESPAPTGGATESQGVTIPQEESVTSVAQGAPAETAAESSPEIGTSPRPRLDSAETPNV